MKELLEEKKSSSDKVKEKEKKIKEQTDTISSIKQQYSKSTVVNKDGYRNARKIVKDFVNAGDLGYEIFKKNNYFYIFRKK